MDPADPEGRPSRHELRSLRWTIIGGVAGILGVVVAVVAPWTGPSPAPPVQPLAPVTVPAVSGAPPASATGVSAGGIEGLREDVQLAEFVRVLGEPVGRAAQGPLVQVDWRAESAIVRAYIDGQNQVIAFAVAAAPSVTPEIPFSGGLRLNRATFAQLPTRPVAIAGNYPADALWSYEERHGGDATTRYRDVAVGAGFLHLDDGRPADAEYEAAGASELLDLQGCVGLPPVAASPPTAAGTCDPARLDTMRTRMVITEFAVGDDGSFQAIEKAGGSLLPLPYSLF